MVGHPAFPPPARAEEQNPKTGADHWPYILAVVHKAFVEVNELGAVAAAATGVGFAASLTPTFRADHPLRFLILDQTTGSVLFLCRVVNPPQDGSE